MPPSRIPLLHPRVVKERLAQHVFPADLAERHAIIGRWVETLRSGALDGAKEVQLHGQFLEQIFGEVLGYRGMVQSGGTAWELIAEQTVSASGKSTDGAIGWFNDAEKAVFAPIELKGARQSLDHAGNRALTPVQQAWEYAQYTPGSRYVIVSNYRETRLYAKARTPDEYEVFVLEELANPEEFRRFYLLLARESLLPSAPPDAPGPNARWEARSLVDELLFASSKKEEEITSALYAEYRGLRRDLHAHLMQVHSNLPARDLLGYTQKILDRLLFVAFAVKRNLLPPDTLEHALTYKDRYRKVPYWQNLIAVFRWIDEGSADPKIPAYNGGLFRPDEELDALEVSDAMCAKFLALARHDFREEISVEVLGHIFEQSIAEFEELEAEAEAGEGGAPEPKPSKRKAEGVYYTPSFITRYIVEETLGRTLAERLKATLVRLAPESEKDGKKQGSRWIAVWEAYREELKRLRVVDLACGSGAFLIAAFDRLAREYDRVNASLASLRGGQAGLFDLTRTVLNANLFGVDVNAESVEITKLSLWLKTAQYGQRLTDLDRNIKWGNSVVDDVLADARAFDWTTGLPATSLLEPPSTREQEEIDARWREKFDVVIGNPPYVRQELLGKYKEHWQKKFRTWAGVADLYVYFIERGFQVLKEGGRLGFIVANKWLRAGYGEALRGLLAKETTIETFVDFGHAPIFPDADAFPCVVTFRKALPTAEQTVEVTQFPRDQLGTVTIAEYVKQNRHGVQQGTLGAGPWGMESPEIESLLNKVLRLGIPLSESYGVKPYYGIKTGFNKAFLVDASTQEQLVIKDPQSSSLFRKYLRGQDIARWVPEWSGEWLLLMKSSGDHEWPWKGQSEMDAEATFASTYPFVHRHMKSFEKELRDRTDQGRYWWELRSCAYYSRFDEPKIFYPDIAWRSDFCIDESGLCTNNTVYFLPKADAWLCAVMNSPLLWTYLWRRAQHGKDEALRLFAEFVETLPIAKPSTKARDTAERIVPRLIVITQENQKARAAMLRSLRLQFGVETPGQKLSDPTSLGSQEFAEEVIARRARDQKDKKKAGKLKASEVTALAELYEETIAPMRLRLGEAHHLERELAEAVNDAYGLTPAEVDLMWKTAPPRMPVGR